MLQKMYENFDLIAFAFFIGYWFGRFGNYKFTIKRNNSIKRKGLFGDHVPDPIQYYPYTRSKRPPLTPAPPPKKP